MIFSPGRVQGASMEPNYYTGDYFIVNKAASFIKSPERFDVVQAVDPQNDAKLLIKRVIGLPGETVNFVNNAVFITDASGKTFPIEETYLAPGTVTREGIQAPSSFVIPDHSYFLLGDNRLVSRDSRDIGPVDQKYINGKVIRISARRQDGLHSSN